MCINLWSVAQDYTHLFTPRKELGVRRWPVTQEHERSVKKAKLRAVRAKARAWRVSGTPASRLGLMIGQIVDDSITLVPKSSSHYPSLWAGVRDGQFVYGDRSAFVHI